MSWQKRITVDKTRIEAEQIKNLRTEGFRILYITESEHEDGVGVTVGLNAIKDGRWSSFRDALLCIGDSRDAMSLALHNNH